MTFLITALLPEAKIVRVPLIRDFLHWTEEMRSYGKSSRWLRIIPSSMNITRRSVTATNPKDLTPEPRSGWEYVVKAVASRGPARGRTRWSTAADQGRPELGAALPTRCMNLARRSRFSRTAHTCPLPRPAITAAPGRHVTSLGPMAIAL